MTKTAAVPPTKEKIAENIAAIMRKYLDVGAYRVFFFGSRAAGTGSERSDFDVGIEGSLPVPFETMAKIREEIADLPTLYTIDVVDFANTDDIFKKVAKQHIEEIRI